MVKKVFLSSIQYSSHVSFKVPIPFCGGKNGTPIKAIKGPHLAEGPEFGDHFARTYYVVTNELKPKLPTHHRVAKQCGKIQFI